MYFTDTPTLNSIEAIMKKLPYGIQKGDAASIGEAVKAVFRETKNAALQKRLSQIYNRKDDAAMIFQSNRHKQILKPSDYICESPAKKPSPFCIC